MVFQSMCGFGTHDVSKWLGVSFVLLCLENDNLEKEMALAM